MKSAKNPDEADKIQERYEDLPHGWIQWKGIAVCMDIYCECGHHSHIDADRTSLSLFAYYVQCPKCKAIYQCNPHVEMIKLNDIDALKNRNCLIMGDDGAEYDM